MIMILQVSGVMMILIYSCFTIQAQVRRRARDKDWQRYVAAHNAAVDRWPDDDGQLADLIHIKIKELRARS